MYTRGGKRVRYPTAAVGYLTTLPPHFVILELFYCYVVMLVCGSPLLPFICAMVGGSRLRALYSLAWTGRLGFVSCGARWPCRFSRHWGSRLRALYSLALTARLGFTHCCSGVCCTQTTAHTVGITAAHAQPQFSKGIARNNSFHECSARTTPAWLAGLSWTGQWARPSCCDESSLGRATHRN
jgi:hypothetical protein